MNKNAIKFIKSLNLKENEYDNKKDEICLSDFFCCGINSCFNDYFDILIDFTLINSKTFNAWIKLLIRNLKKEISDDINNNIEKNYNYKTLPLNEVKDEIKENKEKIIKSDNKIDINDVKGNDEIKDKYLFFMKECDNEKYYNET